MSPLGITGEIRQSNGEYEKAETGMKNRYRYLFEEEKT
jgi:hypothetical protein